jgi:hypothetical protein
MNAKAFRTIARFAACAGVTGVLALGMQTAHHTTTATSASAASTVVLTATPDNNPWEG